MPPVNNHEELAQNIKDFAIALDFLNVRAGARKLVHCPGDFQKFVESKASCCWGFNGPDGLVIEDGLHIAVCAPSVHKVGEKPVLYWDYKREVTDER